jgi:serine/threonine protein kinase/ligand-binding sensor domain-containing protein
MADLIGHMLGQYQIIEQIGVGGMATVYKAYQASMDRYVAIKVLPQQLAEDPEFIGRFEQEALTIAHLENKHILPVYDYGHHNGYTYLVMRYVGTGTLKDLVAQGPLPLADAVHYLAQLADALQYAHDHGVVHRDVKTSNVLTGENRECYLTDFGIAKLAAGAAHFTGTGSVIGTPAYMSPEQCNGLPVDARSDIYSLGIVLYEMLTGALPFEAETPVAVVLKQINEPLPPPRNLNPAIPEAVEQVLFRALAKEPDDRFQSCQSFADALQAAYQSFTEHQTAALAAPTTPPTRPAIDASSTRESRPTTSPPTTPPSARRPRWLLWGGLGALVLAAIIIAGIVLSGGGSKATPTSAPTAIGAAGEVAAPSVSATPGEMVTPTTAEPTVSAGEVAAPATWTVFTSTRGENPGDRQLLISDNALWMSSPGGLVRWQRDGTYTHYTTADGLIFNDIRTMALDQNGDVWLGGGGDQYGVMRLQLDPAGQIAHVDYYDSSNSNLSTALTWDLLPNADGTLLAGMYEPLLAEWDGQQWLTPDLPTGGLDAIGDRAWALLRARDGALWVGGPEGLVHLVGDTWQTVDPPAEFQGGAYEGVEFHDLYEDPLDGAIWVAFATTPDWTNYARRLVPAEDGTWTWEAPPDGAPDSLLKVLRASDNSLWMLGYDSVVHVENGTGTRTVSGSGQGIRGGQYFDLAEDGDGTIWLTTDSALAYFDGRRWISSVTANEPPSGAIVAMAEASGGTLWFVSGYGALATYQNDQWNVLDSLDADTYDILLQGDDVAWLATGGGLVRWQSGRIRRYSPDNSAMTRPEVLALALDPNQPDWLWFGTTDGLYLLNLADDTMHFWSPDHGDFPGPGIATLYFDADGTLWVGTAFDEDWIGPGEAALVKIASPADPENLTWEIEASLDDPFYEGDWDVLAVARDNQGDLWIGTGETLYHRVGERWVRQVESDGAPEFSPVHSIAVTDQAIWFGVWYEGLYRYDRAGWYNLAREGTGTTIIHRLHRTTDGALWVLTDNGIARLVGDPFTLD